MSFQDFFKFIIYRSTCTIENPLWHFQGFVKQEYLGKTFTENTGTEKEENTSYSSDFAPKVICLKFNLIQNG